MFYQNMGRGRKTDIPLEDGISLNRQDRREQKQSCRKRRHFSRLLMRQRKGAPRMPFILASTLVSFGEWTDMHLYEGIYVFLSEINKVRRQKPAHVGVPSMSSNRIWPFGTDPRHHSMWCKEFLSLEILWK